MARLVIDGLRDLRDALRDLPAHLRDEATTIVRARVDGAEQEIRAGYAAMTKSAAHGVDSTGNLLRGLSQNRAEAERFGVRIQLRNRAPHAYLVEVGTETPRKTDRGWNRGRMPAAHVFIPAVIRARRLMFEDLRALLVREGLKVTGD